MSVPMCVCVFFFSLPRNPPGFVASPPPFTVRGRARHNNNAEEEEEEEEGAKNENMQAEGEGEDLPQRGGVKKVVDSGGCVLRGGYPPTWTGILLRRP